MRTAEVKKKGYSIKGKKGHEGDDDDEDDDNSNDNDNDETIKNWGPEVQQYGDRKGLLSAVNPPPFMTATGRRGGGSVGYTINI